MRSGCVLSKEELTRYGRQIKYPSFGEEGQEKLKAAYVAVLGVGGWGALPPIVFVKGYLC